MSSTARIGKYVTIAETIRGFRMILDGQMDDVPEPYFYMRGGIDEVRLFTFSPGEFHFTTWYVGGPSPTLAAW